MKKKFEFDEVKALREGFQESIKKNKPFDVMKFKLNREKERTKL
jgi:hypothetical protein